MGERKRDFDEAQGGRGAGAWIFRPQPWAALAGGMKDHVGAGWAEGDHSCLKVVKGCKHTAPTSHMAQAIGKRGGEGGSEACLAVDRTCSPPALSSCLCPDRRT